MDIDNNSLGSAFVSLLDSIGFCQREDKPTRWFNHILDLILKYGIEIGSLMVFKHNPFSLDHYLITFEFIVCDYKPVGKYSQTGCLLNETVTKFKEMISTALNSTPCLRVPLKLIMLLIVPQAHCE